VSNVIELSAALNAELSREPERIKPTPLELGPGIYYDVPEEQYHADPCARPSLSVSIAKALVLRSPLHAWLQHPRFGAVHTDASNTMDRGSVVHSLLLGRGRDVVVVECDDWKSPKKRAERDAHRSKGRIAVTRKLYGEAIETANVLRAKLAERGYHLRGKSEVTIIWEEQAESGRSVLCRGRLDHWEILHLLDLKITEDANPLTLQRGHITRMGYDIQRAAYTSGVEKLRPDLLGRTDFTFLFCEPEPPNCITPVRCAGTLRELGELKWRRAVNMWDRCLAANKWPEYTEDTVFAEAKPWELEQEDAADENV